MEYNLAKHNALLAVGKKLEKATTHELEKVMVIPILGTLEFFGADAKDLNQFKIDLLAAKFKIWDALGMWYSSEYFQSRPVFRGIDKLVDLYIRMENVGGFAWYLRGHDLDIEEPKKCEDCIKSYEDWHNETPEERREYNDKLEKIFGDESN